MYQTYATFILQNGTVMEPKESILLPTDFLKELNDMIRQNDSLKELIDLIRQKKFHCYNIQGYQGYRAGWCGTCKVSP